MSDFLGAFESELIGEFGADVTETLLGIGDLEDTLSAAAETAGLRVSEAVARCVVGDAFKNLESFIKKQRADSAGSPFIEHTDQMRLCDDAEGGRVWVSLRNVAKWNHRLEKRYPAAPSSQGGEIHFGTQDGTKNPLPRSSKNWQGGGKAADPCAVRQIGTDGSLIENCKDVPSGTTGVGGAPSKPPPGGCCVVS